MWRLRVVARSIAVLALFWHAGSVSAQQFAIGLRSDNDMFNFWVDGHDRTDHEYTAGNTIWLEWRGDATARSHSVASCRGVQTACVYRIRVELAQRMYTPRMADDPDASRQRPHAGYISARIQSSIERDEWQRSLWLEVGAVGPIAFAREIQRLVHELVGLREKPGWDRQLPNEPVLNVGGSIRRRFSLQDVNGSRAAVEPIAMFDAGTGNVSASAGLTAALSFGPLSRLDPGAGGYGARFEVGSHYQAVLRDVLLDGTLFTESRSVRARRAVPHAFGALAVRLQRFDLSYGVYWRGKSYVSEPGGHTFSSLEIGYRTR